MLRNILHCDMNNFYASVECMLDPSLRNHPVAVCGSVEERHGIVLAKTIRQKHLMSRQEMRSGKQNRNVRTWWSSHRIMRNI